MGVVMAFHDFEENTGYRIVSIAMLNELDIQRTTKYDPLLTASHRRSYNNSRTEVVNPLAQMFTILWRTPNGLHSHHTCTPQWQKLQ